MVEDIASLPTREKHGAKIKEQIVKCWGVEGNCEPLAVSPSTSFRINEVEPLTSKTGGD